LKHQTLSKKSKEFWDYSFQTSIFDIAANTDYIYKKTKQKITYFAASQGATAMLAALADPQYQITSRAIAERLDIVHLFAPVVFTVRDSSFFLLRV
jgi:hypothetical protein